MSISGTNEATQSVPFGTPVDTGNANAAGSAATAARSDHVHKGVVANEAWTSWTPTWANLTVGTGTVVAKYGRIGRTIHWRLRFMFDAGSAVGSAPTFTLPVTPSADYVAAAQGTLVGQVTFRDVGTADYSGVVVHTSSGVGRPVVHTAGGTYVAAADLTASVPFVWAQFDTIFAWGTYEAAT